MLSLTSITMHALNVIFMLAEFALNGLLVEAWHLGLVVAWASLYGLFNGLQSILTHDTVYFFMDFSLLWMPVICLGLTCVVLAVHGVACALSLCKRRLLLDAQRDRELLAPPSSSQRATEPLLQAEADRDGARCSATGPLPPGREDGKGGAAREYLLWRDKPGGAAAKPTGAA